MNAENELRGSNIWHDAQATGAAVWACGGECMTVTANTVEEDKMPSILSGKQTKNADDIERVWVAKLFVSRLYTARGALFSTAWPF